MPDRIEAVVGGLICVDLFPGLGHLAEGEFERMFRPGGVITVGPAIFATGGPVSNTGLALDRLGVPTRLISKVGDDFFGRITRVLVERINPDLACGLKVAPGEASPYTIAISPPGRDRFFFHHHGLFETFCADDIDMDLVAQARLFHFGYPPIMRRMYQHGGQELAELFRRVKAAGVTTSLDMAALDPTTEAGQADWVSVFRAALPYVDVFLPSFEETLYALRRAEFERLAQAGPGRSLLAQATPELLASLSGELLDMGVKIAGLKLGDRGLYLRTASREALAGMGRAAPTDRSGWANQELWSPCFRVNVVGTAGSGDATIAGFLSALLHGFSPRRAVTAAVAVGACNVEAADALSGLRSWEETMARVVAGWERHPIVVESPGWVYDRENGLWAGPAL
jgi:sugar/nucleoside kinase (ribokinase family)